ncbi:WD40-repeat-containing domain protein [Pyronema omphalodes]|nr:WD40-repeat-containing domain protein [Pyronema omphalodes]
MTLQGPLVRSQGSSGTENKWDINFSRVNPGFFKIFGDGNKALDRDLQISEKKKLKVSKLEKQHLDRNKMAKTDANIEMRLEGLSRNALMGWVNAGRKMQWLEFESGQKMHWPLLSIWFRRSFPTCHDINQLTRSSNNFDTVIGLGNGEILWYEAFSMKYSVINKKRITNDHPVLAISWLPGDPNLFIAAHRDGSLLIYDRRKKPSKLDYNEFTLENRSSHLAIIKSVKSSDQKTNPVAAWKSLGSGHINALKFSPDGRLLAYVDKVGEIGRLQVLKFHEEKLLWSQFSYYEQFNCICWSPDGRYIITGGGDGLITIWTHDGKLVARGEGHYGPVTDISFDLWRCKDLDSTTDFRYIFGSVDCNARILLWDFMLQNIVKPEIPVTGKERELSLPMRKVARIMPVMNVFAAVDEPCVPPWSGFTQVWFREDAIWTCDEDGRLKAWERMVDPERGFNFKENLKNENVREEDVKERMKKQDVKSKAKNV